MTYDCYCDGETFTVYRTHKVRASRKRRKCDECNRPIAIGESYTYAFGVYEGKGASYATCTDCQKLVDYLVASFDCYCHMHGAAFDGLRDFLEDAYHRAPNEMRGVRFRVGRLLVARNRASKLARQQEGVAA